MVFESVVTDILNKVLGDYIENLDRKQLKIGIWGGDVVLENLKIRENALDDLDLPVQMVYGYLGKLVLKIPWKNLYGEPVIVQIDDLYALVLPNQNIIYDEEKQLKYELQVKLAKLQEIADARKRELEKDKPKPDAGFIEKLTAQIVNNLQVKIENVHVRYEDSSTTGKPFALGVSLHELELYTTNTDWEKSYMSEQGRRVFKIAKLSCLSVYFNCNSKLYSNDKEEEIKSLFQQHVARADSRPSHFNYIVGPISCLAKLKININPENDDPPFQIPKIELCLEMENLNVGLTSTQFQNGMKLADAFNRMQLGLPYRKFRPHNIPYKGYYADWWRFAITAVMEDVKRVSRNWSWQHMQQHRDLCKSYADKFKERECCVKPSATLVEACVLLEQKLDLFNLVLIRKRVELDIEKERENEAQLNAQKPTSSWFSGWFTSGKKEATEGDIVKKFEAAMTGDEKAKLYKAIGYHENAIVADVPPEYVSTKMDFKLMSLDVGVYDDSNQQQSDTQVSYNYQDLETIFLLRFTLTTFSISQRPAANAIQVAIGMKSMKLTGLKRDSISPVVVDSKITEECNLLDVFYESNPLDGSCDHRVKITARPIEVIYEAETVNRVREIFTPDTNVNISELEGAATAQLSDLKERSATGIQYMIDKRAKIDVDIILMPNVVIVPHGGAYAADEKSLIVISLGKVQVTCRPNSCDCSREPSLVPGSNGDSDEYLRTALQNAYERIDFVIDDIQVLVVKPQEPWQEVLQSAACSKLHVLLPTSIQCAFAVCCINNDPRLPKTKIDVVLPTVQCSFIEHRIYELLRILTSMPFPADEEPPTLSSVRKSAQSVTSSISNLLVKDAQRKMESQTASAIDLGEDQQQYTSLEISFAIKSVLLNVYQSTPETSSCARSPTISADYGTPIADELPPLPDDTRRSTVEELTLSSDLQILKVQLLHVEATLAQRTFELVASAKLGAINVKQFDCFENTKQELDIIDTPKYSESLESLLTVSLKTADKSSPTFATAYNSTVQLVVINFTTLNVTLHLECILRLLRFSNNFQTELQSILSTGPPRDRFASAAEGTDLVKQKLAIILEEDEGLSPLKPTASASNKKRRTGHKVVESIQLHVVANLNKVSVMLTSRKRHLALMQVRKFDAGIIVKSSYTELNLRLKDIVVNDMNCHSIHENILTIVGSDALKCQVIMYNLEETSNYNSDDMKVSIDIGCIRVVFINWFIAGVMNFLNHFQQAQEALARASANAADAARQNAINAYQKATRIKLDIQVKAPIVVVPVDSQSTDALALDLGMLVLSNTTSELRDASRSENGAVVLDEIKLELKDMKLSKVTVVLPKTSGEREVHGSTDTIDKSYGLKSNVNIMNPINFTVSVRRNLSSTWYRGLPEVELSGRLKSIELNVFKDDYALIMSILSNNLTEGADEFPAIEVDTSRGERPTQTGQPQSQVLDEGSARSHATNKADESAVNDNRYEKLKFSLQFDGAIVNLLLSEKESLARFGIYFLSVKGNVLMDGTISTSIVLCNMQIDDKRTSSKSQIKQYLSRKGWKPLTDTDEIIEHCYNERNYMIDITALIKEDDIYAKASVCSFDLIMCIDFLMELVRFMEMPAEAPPNQSARNSISPGDMSPVGQSLQGLQVQALVETEQRAVAADNHKKIQLILNIDEPDIILVENLDDLNTNAIIFNAQACFNYRSIGSKQLVSGEVNALKMFICSFLPERRDVTKHYILHPCVISLQGSTPEEEGMHIAIKLSDIIINISPAAIELFNKAMCTISTNATNISAVERAEADFSDIWFPTKFKDRQYWFVKVDQATDALKMLEDAISRTPVKPKSEKCIIEVPCITIVFESGVGYYTTPMISLDTRMNATISNWTNDLSINGSLTLCMNYFNQHQAEWEPIIEMIEHINKSGESIYSPWELNFNLSLAKIQNDFEEGVVQDTSVLKIHSEENLEVTLTKTCIALLNELKDVFYQAIDAKGLARPQVHAPFVVENDTGFDMMIDFSRGIFTLHECHTPSRTVPNALNNSLIFQMGFFAPTVNPNKVKSCIISAGGRAYLQTKELTAANMDDDEDYSIYVKVGDIDKEIVLPVSKSDKRYFPISRSVSQDVWGIVSDVSMEYGTTKINVHGVVDIKNHFTTSIKIYRRKPHSSQTVLVGEVGPDEVFHVPLHAIYTNTKEFFFSLSGYNTSVQGFRWDENLSDANLKHQLQCDPIETFEPLYINAVRNKEEIYYEHTNKYKLLSIVYVIHLRPPLYLRNSLPISIRVSVSGCSVRTEDVEIGEEKELHTRATLDAPKSYMKEHFLDYGEKEVDPGDVLHLPTVKFAGNNKESRSFLVVRLLQYLEKDWSCATEISNTENEVVVWRFSSYDSAVRMDMDLSVNYTNRHGSVLLTLYSPFWLINKTGLMLTYKTDIATCEVLYHPPEYTGPILFTFREKLFFDKKKASIRVENGDWSEKIPLDVAGSMGSVACKNSDYLYQIGVHNHLTQNSLTKQITFIPFYIASNKCYFTIELQEQSRPGDPWIRIEPLSCEPIWPKNNSDHMIVARVNGQRTPAFNYSEVICTLLKLEKNKLGGINVDVQTTEGGVYITFTPYEKNDAPGLLINHTSQPIKYYEKHSKHELVLQPHHKVMYTWSDPVGEKKLVFGKNKQESDLKRDAIGTLKNIDGTESYWVSFLDGLQRVLLFTEDYAIASKTETSAALQTITHSLELKIHGIGLSVLNNETGGEVLYLGITNSGIIWEMKKPDKKRFKQMSIHDSALLEAQYQQYLLDKSVNQRKSYTLENKYPIDFDTWSLRKGSERVIQRNFYPGIWLSMKSSPFQSQIHFKINKIQLDNQLDDPIFPVVLAAIAPPKSVATITTMKPFIECSVVQRVMQNTTVKQFKYASVLMQEFHFKVDLLFLTAIAELFTSQTNDEYEAKAFRENVKSIERPLSDFFETESQQQQKNFYDNLHLGPMKIHVSFSMAGADATALPGFLGTIVQGVGITLTDVNDVVFRLAFFEREYMFFTQQQLISEITSHYTGQALKQLYVLVLGLDVLGNPYGLVVGLKKGVEDLFYEPFQGAIQGPGEFAEGLVLGVKSLFGHTVGGAAGAMSKITGAVGKGLATLTFDDDYQRKRRNAMNNKPRNFQEGIARSGKGLVMGFVDGVTGVVTKPVSGAREQGVEGFFKGLGKGTIGLVARPTAGVVDFASGSFDAVKRATETTEDVNRLRPPRFQHHDNIVRPYCSMEAKGNRLLKSIEKGKYATTDYFVHCEEIVQGKEYLLISNHRVLYISRNEMFGSWSVHWTYLWSELSGAAATERGIELKLKKESRKMMGILSSRAANNKIVLLAYRAKRLKVAEIIENLRQEA